MLNGAVIYALEHMNVSIFLMTSLIGKSFSGNPTSIFRANFMSLSNPNIWVSPNSKLKKSLTTKIIVWVVLVFKYSIGISNI